MQQNTQHIMVTRDRGNICWHTTDTIILITPQEENTTSTS
jgi:hypothetical protein